MLKMKVTELKLIYQLEKGQEQTQGPGQLEPTAKKNKELGTLTHAS